MTTCASSLRIRALSATLLLLEKSAGVSPSVLSFLNYHIAINKHILDPLRKPTGLLESCTIYHSLGIEDYDVRGLPLGDHSSIFQSKSIRWEAGHFSNRLVQAQDTLFPDVATENAWEGSVVPWMRVNVCVVSLRGESLAVG